MATLSEVDIVARRDADDLALLRTYEPVVRYTEGELFFPCAVDEYVRRSSLVIRADERRRAAELVGTGGLDLDVLAYEGAADPSRSLALWFVHEPLRGREYQRWLRRPGRPTFHGGGRLSRVGLFPRFVDSLFSLSLLLRGRVPGGTAAGAEQRYAAMQGVAPGYVYYGRVVRERGYVVLQYLFFYVMNDWRSTFSGVNDHEADWEQAFVYLTEVEDGPPEPAWVAFAAHDYSGDDLRRRWDDPELTKEGTHPVVFAGAGSHASYFKQGEYLTGVPLRPLDPLMRVVRVVRRVWRDVLRQGDGDEIVQQAQSLLSIPFVDYARGDGRAIGPSQKYEWSPILLTDGLGWVEQYRGLWGLDTRDPLSGEIAPSGPKYNRDGSIRQSWYDPLGWAGLEKVAPATQVAQVLEEQVERLEGELADADRQLATMEEDLARRDLEVRSLRPIAYLGGTRRTREQELSAKEAERNALRRRRVETAETLAACRRELALIEAGEPGDPRAHLKHTHDPQPPEEIRTGRLVETWAGLSTGLLLLGGVLVMVFDIGNWLTALLTLVGAVVLVENILHRSVTRLLLNVTIVLAVICAAVLFYEFFWQAMLAGVTLFALFILWDNVKELRRG